MRLLANIVGGELVYLYLLWYHSEGLVLTLRKHEFSVLIAFELGIG